MRRDPFDERCTCDHDEPRGNLRLMCVCLKPLLPPNSRCAGCKNGNHVLRYYRPEEPTQ